MRRCLETHFIPMITVTRPEALRGAGLVLLMLLLGACATAPVQEMSDARQAVMAAEQASAEEHAPESLNQARNLLARAQQNLKVRNFEDARDEALRAKEQAMQALRESQVAQRRPADADQDERRD